MRIEAQMDLDRLAARMGGEPIEEPVVQRMRTLLVQGYAGRDTDELPAEAWQRLLDDAGRPYLLLWISADGQDALPQGRYESEQAARNAIPAMQTKLLAQSSDDAEREAIHAGSWEIES